MTGFEFRLSKRKKKLNDSVQLHRLIEAVSTLHFVCECVSVCGGGGGRKGKIIRSKGCVLL